MNPSEKNILFIKMEPGGKNPKNFHISTISVDYDFKNVIGVRITKDIVLVKIEVDNMEPTLLPGDVFICQKSQVMTFVPNESASVIVSKKGCFARRIHKHHLRNYFFLSNH